MSVRIEGPSPLHSETKAQGIFMEISYINQKRQTF